LGEIRITIPPSLHKALRMRAVTEDMTLKNFVIVLLERTLTVELLALGAEG